MLKPSLKLDWNDSLYSIFSKHISCSTALSIYSRIFIYSSHSDNFKTHLNPEISLGVAAPFLFQGWDYPWHHAASHLLKYNKLGKGQAYMLWARNSYLFPLISETKTIPPKYDQMLFQSLGMPFFISGIKFWEVIHFFLKITSKFFLPLSKDSADVSNENLVNMPFKQSTYNW